MKKIYFSILIIIGLGPSAFAQSNFDPEDYHNYREKIKDISAGEILEKYPPKNTYYSERKLKSSLESFQYLDSIDLRYLLTPYEKELLKDNHFMVTERLSHRSFANAFVDIYSSDLPLFLSTDFFLHALHISYEVMLRDLEAGVLEPNLHLLLHSMKEQIPGLYSKNNTNSDISQSIEDVDLYLSVAISLLENTTTKPRYDQSGKYSILMDAINNQNPPVLEMGLFSKHSRKIDISQFKPRGHYTEEFWWEGKQKDLKNYFKAMMWLGRIDFMLTAPPTGPSEPEWSDEDLQRMSRGAMILNQILDASGNRQLFEMHEKIISFFVGPDDNLSPDELNGIVRDLNLSPEDLSDPVKWAAFKQKINGSDDYGQKIMSNFFIVDKDKENPAELPVSYRLLGQKFLIDSYVFSEVVYDRVYHKGVEVHRMLPDPLDAMFVLGNENALPLLENELNKYHYAYKLEELRYLTDSYDPVFWQQSLYNTWLNAIRQLNPKENISGLPYFMKTTEWQLEKMNTQLSSWAELRHDNVLYAKQSYTGGTSCSFPYVYIEPYPGFFSVLKEFATGAADFFENELTSMNYSKKSELIKFYRNFGKHMDKIRILTEKELRQEKFVEDEISYLKRFINGAMASGPSITGWFNELFYDSYKAMQEDYLVVDVHTQPTDQYGNVVGKILHVGTGNVNLGVFCAGSPFNDYQPAAFVGPVMSFHTRIEKNWNRLTDDEWMKFFWDHDNNPVRPDWVNHYLASYEGTKRGNGHERNLKGYTFEETGLNPSSRLNDIAYLLAFPNPAGENSSIRFVLNHPAAVQAEIVDILGKKHAVILNERLPAGEHKRNFSVADLEAGLYFIRLNTGWEQRSIRLMIR